MHLTLGWNSSKCLIRNGCIRIRVLWCNRESGQPRLRVGCIWCRKHQELHPLSQCTVERIPTTYNSWSDKSQHYVNLDKVSTMQPESKDSHLTTDTRLAFYHCCPYRPFCPRLAYLSAGYRQQTTRDCCGIGIVAFPYKMEVLSRLTYWWLFLRHLL